MIGDRGLVGYEKFATNSICVHKGFIALIIGAFLAITILLVSLEQKDDEAFKRFIEAEKAGMYHGVIMSPLQNPHTEKHEGKWLVEIVKTRND